MSDDKRVTSLELGVYRYGMEKTPRFPGVWLLPMGHGPSAVKIFNVAGVMESGLVSFRALQ